MRDTEIVIIKRRNEAVKNIHPSLPTHIYDSILSESQNKRNYDLNFRNFWKTHKEKIKSQFVLFVDQNVNFKGKLEFYFQEVENHLGVASVVPIDPEDEAYTEFLPLKKHEIQKALFIKPVFAVLFPRKALDAWCDTKWDAIMSEDIVDQIRLPSLMYNLGFFIKGNNSIKLQNHKRNTYQIKTPSEKPKYKDKKSIVAVSMNRNNRVIPCIKSWCSSDLFDDIVLVDWSSNPKIKDDPTIESFLNENPKVNLVRVDDEKYFNLGRSYNLGVEKTKNKEILKIDIDYVLKNEEFCKYLSSLDLSSSFYSTFHGWPYEFWGMLYFKKEDFYKAGGYDENLNGWGEDDIDMSRRLEKIAEKHKLDTSNCKYLHHIPHGDELRTANYEIKNKWHSYQRNQSIVRERNKKASQQPES